MEAEAAVRARGRPARAELARGTGLRMRGDGAAEDEGGGAGGDQPAKDAGSDGIGHEGFLLVFRDDRCVAG